MSEEDQPRAPFHRRLLNTARAARDMPHAEGGEVTYTMSPGFRHIIDEIWVWNPAMEEAAENGLDEDDERPGADSMHWAPAPGFDGLTDPGGHP